MEKKNIDEFETTENNIDEFKNAENNFDENNETVNINEDSISEIANESPMETNTESDPQVEPMLTNQEGTLIDSKPIKKPSNWKKNLLVTLLVVGSLVGAGYFVKYSLQTMKESEVGTYESAKKAVDNLFVTVDSDEIKYNLPVDDYNLAKTKVEAMADSTKKVALTRRLQVAKPKVESQEKAKTLVSEMYIDAEHTKPNIDRTKSAFVIESEFPKDYDKEFYAELWTEYKEAEVTIKEAWELEESAKEYYVNGDVPANVTVAQINYLLEKINMLPTSVLKTNTKEILENALSQATKRDATIESEYKESISNSISIKSLQDSISESKQAIVDKILAEQESIARERESILASESVSNAIKESTARQKIIDEANQKAIEAASLKAAQDAINAQSSQSSSSVSSSIQ